MNSPYPITSIAAH
ncbi:hypothetical protein VCHC56A2_1819, partial [Vibrio cholerae HC-56A2]